MAEKPYDKDVVNGHEVDTEAVEDPNGAGAPEFAENKDLRYTSSSSLVLHAR
jgi:hypothetical protein